MVKIIYFTKLTERVDKYFNFARIFMTAKTQKMFSYIVP